LIYNLEETGILRIILNRPKRGNGFTFGMYVLMAEYLNRANADAKVKVIVLSGNRFGKNKYIKQKKKKLFN
jgi:enoyl-CoA hydratase